MMDPTSLSLGLRARRADETLSRAALDITTGYGVDSFFSRTVQDPWARECVERFCDVLVHHSDVVYPVPDDMTLRDEELEVETPSLFTAVSGGRDPMIAPLRETTAEHADLFQSEVAWLWNGFDEWTRADKNAGLLRSWLRLHEEARIRLTRRQTNLYIAGAWNDLPTANVRHFVGVTDHQLQYAFDTYARTLRYHRILGEATIYFPHPLRRPARARDECISDGMTWSWGRFLVNAMRQDLRTRDGAWMIEQVAAIRGAAARAGVQDHWYTVARKPADEQRDIIEGIARDARLPPKLTLGAQRDANLLVQGGAAAASLTAPLVSLAVGLTAMLIGGNLDGTVPPRVASWRFMQGYLYWPELLTGLTQ